MLINNYNILEDVSSDDTNSCQESTDVIEEEQSDNEQSTNLCNVGNDTITELEDTTAQNPQEGDIDETFYISEEFDGDDEDDEEEDEDEDGLDLDGYDDNELYSDVEFIHLEFPSWNLGAPSGWSKLSIINKLITVY